MGKTLAEEIYEIVKKDILELRMKPGEKISEATLARRYQVSRAPIRNVIQKLQQEEFVLVKPQVGTLIMPISLKKARDILQIRMLLETHAAEIAAETITDRELAELEGSFRRLRQRPPDSEAKRQALFATDHLLHQTIWNLCGNREIYNIINNYRDETNRIRLATLELANRLAPSEQEMRRIYLALKKRDPRGARDAMRLHICNIRKAIEYGVRKTPAKNGQKKERKEEESRSGFTPLRSGRRQGSGRGREE